MSVQKVKTDSGATRYKARVKFHGREVATRQFERRADAVAWEQDQARLLRRGDWVDPRRGRVSLAFVAKGWLLARDGLKRRSREADALQWRKHIEPRFGTRPIATISAAEVSEWAAQLVANGLAASSARRALATFRSILDHAIADDRLHRNVAKIAKPPLGPVKREGQRLEIDEVGALAAACKGPYGQLVLVLAYTGLRWGELAGLQAGDRLRVPAPGIRVQRAVLAGGKGELYVDTLKNYRCRTVPLITRAADVVAAWSTDRDAADWIFPSVKGTPLSENNWKRMVGWNEAKRSIGRPTLRVHDLRHTAASIWLGTGADVKVVQSLLGHASATMTLDLYGHLIDKNLWDNAKLIGDRLGIVSEEGATKQNDRDL